LDQNILKRKEKIEREDNQPPFVTEKLGWRYHHIGIPTTEVKDNETYIPKYKMYVSGFSRSPFGIEWMRFEPGSPISEIIQHVPHIAFEIDNLDEAVKGLETLAGITSPSEGVRVAMIVDNGAPVELIEFRGVKTD
jgi:hypothetical protein